MENWIRSGLAFSSENTVTCILIAVASVLLVWHFEPRWKHYGYKLPPGPMGLPFVGYFPFMGKDPHLDLEKLREKYGNIFGMYVGSKYLVVLSDFNSIRKSFNTDPLLGRPDKFFRVSTNHKNIGEMNGQPWFEQRQHLVTTFKKIFGPRNQTLQDHILEEIGHLLTRVQKTTNQPRMNMRKEITPSINNVIYKEITGSWFEDDHPMMILLTRLEEVAAELFTNISILYFFPWFVPFYNRSAKMREMADLGDRMEQFLWREIEEHESKINPDNPQDYLDHYLLELTKPNIPRSFNRNTLNGNALFLLTAGSDTVRNTLEWGLMIMAKYPDIQERVHNEIVDNFGTTIIPRYTEKEKIPYTDAVIAEITRWRALTVLNCMRETTADTNINGYDIPKGSYVINSIWACHMNPEEWKDPAVFDPGRFLTNDNTRVVQKENLITFSYGRRMCPGDKLAKVELFLMFSALMQRFKFVPPEGGLNFATFVKINAQSVYPFVKVLPRDTEN